jgi:hypothetical protein
MPTYKEVSKAFAVLAGLAALEQAVITPIEPYGRFLFGVFFFIGALAFAADKNGKK